MINDYFKLYCQNNIDLARSIVIKVEDAALLINRNLTLSGDSVDYDDPTTWKYYLNLNGEYYIGNSAFVDNSDEVMKILTSEDGTEVDLTKATLTSHPLTRASIKSYLPSLIDTYPKQENLIHNIINPIDINTAINAKNFEILSYDKSLVAENELSLMAKIQKWIYDFYDRWYKSDFGISDPYYLSAFLGTMYLKLPAAIMNFRLEMCGTPEVDDFHLWNFLNDHYELGKYRNSLSRRQALWLYRNMVDFQRNAGKQWVLEELIKNLAEPKGLVAKKYDFLKQTPDSLMNGLGLGAFVEREFWEEDIDLSDDPILDSEQMIFKTRNRAIKNRTDLKADQQELDELAYFETSSPLPTTLIQFDLDTNALSQLVSDIKTRIEYWLYLSATGNYSTVINVEVPNSGILSLSPKDAFVLYEYARHARSGIHLNEVEPLFAKEVVSFDPSVGLANFRDVIPEKYISDDFIMEALADRIPSITVTDPASLELYAEAIISRRIRHNLQINYINDLDVLPHAKNVVEGVYDDYLCVLEPIGTAYNDWLANKRVRRFSMSSTDWHDLMLKLLLAFTGIDPDNIGIGISKQAMIEIIDAITSYGLIITNGAGNGDVNELPVPHLHPDKTESSKVVDIWSHMCNIRLMDGKYENNSRLLEIDFDMGLMDDLESLPSIVEHEFDPTLDFEHAWDKDDVAHVPIPSLTVFDPD